MPEIIAEKLPTESASIRLLKAATRAVLPDFLLDHPNPSSADVQNIRSVAIGVEATAIGFSVASNFFFPGIGLAPLVVYAAGKGLHAMAESFSKFRAQPQKANI